MTWFAFVLAAITPSDFQDELVISVWDEVHQTIVRSCSWGPGGPDDGLPPLGCDEEALKRAENRALRFGRDVVADARLTYLAGLSARYRRDMTTARERMEAAVELDPTRAEIWLDLGYLWLKQGSIPQARAAFEKVVEQVDSGPNAWVGPFQLADLDARAQQPEAFRDHLRQALRLGFRPELLAGKQVWAEYLRNPVIGPELTALLEIYGGQDVLDQLRSIEP